MSTKSLVGEERKTRLREISLFAIFTAIQLLLFFTPLGFIPVGPLSLTTLHLPVLLVGIILGPVYGGISGFLFGLLSFFRNTFAPGVTSFVFTPFVNIGGISGNFWSLVICFVPRILIGVLPSLLTLLFNKVVKKGSIALKGSIASGISTILHTAMVLGGIYLIFADSYAQALGKTKDAVATILGTTILTNGIAEAVLAVLVVYLVAKIYFRYLHKGDSFYE